MNIKEFQRLMGLGENIANVHLRVTFYGRVSTDHLEQKGSLRNQCEFMEEMIKKNEHWEYIPGYIDEGISGTTDYKRESFLKMIEDAKRGLFDLIITKEISRFSRNTLDSIKYTRELKDYGVGVYFINDNINTFLPDAELRLTIMASLAQDEVRRLSERVKFGMLRSIKRGVILGNDHQYGYRKINNELIIIDTEAKVVKRLFTYYAIDHLSLGKIARIFNEENIKTSFDKKWNVTTLRRMIENPKYKGDYCGRKTEIIDYMSKKKIILPASEWIYYENFEAIPPIISTELWNLANKRLKMRQRKNNSYQNRYLLSAKVFCSHDHASYHRKGLLRSSNDSLWICANALNNGRLSCPSPIIRESEIIKILNDIISFLGFSLEHLNDILKSFYDDEILKKISNEEIYDHLRGMILKRIDVDGIKDDIFLNIDLNIDNVKDYYKDYIFKRGENIRGTKCYDVRYHTHIASKKE